MTWCASGGAMVLGQEINVEEEGRGLQGSRGVSEKGEERGLSATYIRFWG